MADTVNGDDDCPADCKFISRIIDVGVIAFGQGMLYKSKSSSISLLPP